eukprot:364779-Chlamydomonas_euryale.AAC.29
MAPTNMLLNFPLLFHIRTPPSMAPHSEQVLRSLRAAVVGCHGLSTSGRQTRWSVRTARSCGWQIASRKDSLSTFGRLTPGRPSLRWARSPVMRSQSKSWTLSSASSALASRGRGAGKRKGEPTVSC